MQLDKFVNYDYPELYSFWSFASVKENDFLVKTLFPRQISKLKLQYNKVLNMQLLTI
jgi:hypothetical protein